LNQSKQLASLESEQKPPIVGGDDGPLRNQVGATGFEPRVALDLLPYLLLFGRPKLRTAALHASVGSTEASEK
jgi:hypothetical protein